MSSTQTFRWLTQLLRHLPAGVRIDVPELNYALRKAGHLFGYGALGVVFLRAWSGCFARRTSHRSRLGWASALGVASTALIASLDELHQSFLPNREASLHDVLLDTSGAVLLIGAAALWRWCSHTLLVRRSALPGQRPSNIGPPLTTPEYATNPGA